MRVRKERERRMKFWVAVVYRRDYYYYYLLREDQLYVMILQ
jgi:hypothetical protein